MLPWSTEVGHRESFRIYKRMDSGKSVSKVMAERGHFVSLQQCEDKFNDLNKWYKRLNEIFGRDVYGNRLHLPPDPVLQHSLILALRARDDHDNDGNDDDDDQDPYMDEYDDYHHHHGVNLDQRTVCGVGEGSSKKVKQNEDSQMKNVQMDMIQEGGKLNLLQDHWLNNHLLQLEEQKIHIQAQMLELEKERFKWKRFQRKKDT
ncbi:putative myb/SANT-like DNA-binding domain 4 [Helianthus annuus]|nr:putative myb/SANT-like DNA-binding domain 4 [Helianthus annuus]